MPHIHAVLYSCPTSIVLHSLRVLSPIFIILLSYLHLYYLQLSKEVLRQFFMPIYDIYYLYMRKSDSMKVCASELGHFSLHLYHLDNCISNLLG